MFTPVVFLRRRDRILKDESDEWGGGRVGAALVIRILVGEEA